jgi:hypothetical protein
VVQPYGSTERRPTKTNALMKSKKSSSAKAMNSPTAVFISAAEAARVGEQNEAATELF